MGTVHAKSVDPEDTEEEKARVDLQGLKAQVQRVHVSGLGRTKDDLIIFSVRDIFEARDFQSVILKIHEAKTKLAGLGCFKAVDVVIDTYDGADAMQDGIQVTFEVEELNLIGLRVNTAIGLNEGILSGGGALRNVFGRGEEINANYSHGTKKTTSFAINFVKPFHNECKTKFSSSIYQSCVEAGWAGYKEVDRGLLLGLAFSAAPNVTQQLVLDTAWRQLSCLSKSTAFAIREHCGHTLKSAIRHEISIDTRDDNIFPSDGQLMKMKNEIAGFGGNIGYIKNEASWQSNVPLPFNVVAQASLSAGHLFALNSKGTSICDRFVMGGPMTMRGFQLGGIGPHSDTCAVGAEAFWCGGVHLYTPLPLLTQGTFTDRFRVHMWANIGNIGDWKMDGSAREKLATLVRDMRLSYGAGIALNVAGLARVELNYCLPLLSKRGDKLQHGVQFGIAADVL
uniref:Sorting and assembly machinery component 50 homolog A-like n=1 Tax=Hirondellea gigas TaxID=1518452 RepID=A0A2P2HZM2_9CRUS